MKRKYHDNLGLRNEYKNMKYKENPELKKEHQKKKNQGKKKVKVQKFHSR